MGEVRPPQPVKLFIATLYEDREVLNSVLPSLVARFGDIEWQSDPIPFTYTDYYRDIGERLLRVFLVFRDLIDPGTLPEIKLFTNELERATADANHPRRINLDPGYFDGGKIVLATTKNFSHRVYIGKGIYAEATIKWEKGDFHPFPYTYPDYQSEAYRPILRKIRELYRASLKTWSSNPKSA
ncbi:MAG: DUF4416 family protein [Candidatus Caldatribacterium sp.]|nr:DUF4416 family protein [Candidatus Caldatribacterium sp.]